MHDAGEKELVTRTATNNQNVYNSSSKFAGQRSQLARAGKTEKRNAVGGCAHGFLVPPLPQKEVRWG